MAYGVIYRVRNTVNGKVYIGQTTMGLAKRWACHLSDARTSRVRSPLYPAIRKYGEAAFTCEQIGEADSKAALDALEVAAIRGHGSLDPAKGYNAREGGSAGKLSPEARAKMSAARSGEKHWRHGRPVTDQERQRLKAMRSAQVFTPESIAKRNQANRGRTHTPETRARIAEKLRGRPMPEHVKAALKAAQPTFGNRAIAIVCLSNDMTFPHMKAAAAFAGVSRSSMTRHIAGKHALSSGLKFAKVTP